MASVGRLAGVSQVTVSRALSDPSKVSAEALKRINDAIKITGFVPNAVAGALASSRSMLVSALVPSITNPVYSSMIGPFSELLRAQGYQILLSETGLDVSEEYFAVQKHLSRRPDAMLLTGVQHSPETKRLLLASGIPVVEVWETTNSPIDICVGFDHTAASYATAEFLSKRGYAHAALISANDRRAISRMSAFATRFEVLGGSIVARGISQSQNGIVAGRTLFADMMNSHDFPPDTVLICSSDTIANGAMIEAQFRGLSIPRDVAVVGFGDQDFAAYLEPALTTIRVDRDALGRAAAEAILSRLNKLEANANVVDIGFSLVARSSVGEIDGKEKSNGA